MQTGSGASPLEELREVKNSIQKSEKPKRNFFAGSDFDTVGGDVGVWPILDLYKSFFLSSDFQCKLFVDEEVSIFSTGEKDPNIQIVVDQFDLLLKIPGLMNRFWRWKMGRAAERDQSLRLSSLQRLTKYLAFSTGTSGRMPWPRLKMWRPSFISSAREETHSLVASLE